MSKDNQNKSGKPFATEVEGPGLDTIFDKDPTPTPVVPEADVNINVAAAEAPIAAPQPTGSKRLQAEMEAGRAALARKHGPGQLEKEQTAGKKAANKG